jgi:hypothetical protein
MRFHKDVVCRTLQLTNQLYQSTDIPSTVTGDKEKTLVTTELSNVFGIHLFTLMRIRILLSTLMRIRILLSTLMRIRILLRTKVIGISDSKLSGLHCERQWPSTALFEPLSLQAFKFDFYADPDPAFYSNADPDPQPCQREVPYRYIRLNISRRCRYHIK